MLQSDGRRNYTPLELKMSFIPLLHSVYRVISYASLTEKQDMHLSVVLNHTCLLMNSNHQQPKHRSKH